MGPQVAGDVGWLAPPSSLSPGTLPLHCSACSGGLPRHSGCLRPFRLRVPPTSGCHLVFSPYWLFSTMCSIMFFRRRLAKELAV